MKAKDVLYNSVPMTVTDWLVDIVIAAGAFGFGILQLTLSANSLLFDEFTRRMINVQPLIPSAIGLFYVALTTVPLVVRRRLPWVVLAFILVSWAVLQAQFQIVSISPVGPMIAVFTVAFERTRIEALIAGSVAVVLVALVPVHTNAQILTQLTIVQNIALIVAAALAGYAFHLRQDYVREAEERARAAELSLHREAERRVEEERVRIAREVHDITAHSLSAVSIQAAAAERLIDKDPTAAKESIRTVRQTAKSSLNDIRALIGVLRAGDERPEQQPTQGTDRLGDLVEYLKGAGINATLDVKGYERSEVPAHIDVAFFGIAREAMTNIVRHAHAKNAAIVLTSNGEEASLTVKDDGSGTFGDQGSEGSGHGIEGMRERVRLLGGSFEAGDLAEGGFVVWARVPIARGEEA